MNNLSHHRYVTVDVFTERPLEGNPLAVFPDASGISDITMQKIARELNLSETVFVHPATRPDCAVGIRIFTPTMELSFAGHPTIGASFVVLEEKIVPKSTERFVLEEKVGPVHVRVEPLRRSLTENYTMPAFAQRRSDSISAIYWRRLHKL